MKQIKYTGVTIVYHSGQARPAMVSFSEDALAGADEVAQQILAKQDIRYTDNGITNIIKWDSVIKAMLVRAVEDVAAPHDDICDGYCDKKGLNIELKDISSKCYTLDGANLASMSFVVGGETITVPVLDGDVSGLIKAKTYDCEAVNAEIAYEMALSEGTATLTITATYNGDTVTKTISAETECA